MPRKARLSVPGSVTHVMARSLDGVALFSEDQDREQFLDLLARYVHQTDCRCYAWALMSNHYHLLIRQGPSDLWRTMKPLNMRYAQYHRKKYGRRGPLFMDRYKSIVTQDQNYIQELVRYVHLNPVRAGICTTVSALSAYPWSGHGALMGRCVRAFQDTATVLRRFGADERSARRAYVHFMTEGIGRGDEQDIIGYVRASNAGQQKGREACRWVIGDREFVSRVLNESHIRRLRMRSADSADQQIARIAQSVCRAYNIAPELLSIRHRGGPVSQARKAFAFICIRTYDMPTRIVAEKLKASPGAASNLARAGVEPAKKVTR